MSQSDKDLLLKDLCARLPYNVAIDCRDEDSRFTCYLTTDMLREIQNNNCYWEYKPYLFPLSSMTDEDYTIYSKIWEDTGKTAYLEGCHHLISTIKAYKAGNDYLLSKQYDVNGLIPMGLAIDATGLNIY